jgi:hypothetical protein
MDFLENFGSHSTAYRYNTAMGKNFPKLDKKLNFFLIKYGSINTTHSIVWIKLTEPYCFLTTIFTEQ